MNNTQMEFLFDGASEKSGEATARRHEVAQQPLACNSQAVGQAYEQSSAQFRADALHAFLRASAGVAIRLRITNNSSTMMSLRYEKAGGRAIVGLHHMFLDAPPAVQKALATWIVRPRAKAAGKILEAYIADRRHLIKSGSARPIKLRTEGVYQDLQRLFNEVNEAEFDGSVSTPITWGKMPTQRRRRSIRFGSYTPADDLIRIHPYLDQAFVPEFFVRYIVFHEMLHAHMGIEETPSGRRRIHPPAFRRREEEYGEYERAVAWMNDEGNLRRLLLAPKS